MISLSARGGPHCKLIIIPQQRWRGRKKGKKKGKKRKIPVIVIIHP